MEITFIYIDPEDRKEIEEYDGTRTPLISYLDYGSKLSKSKSYKLMQEWGGTFLNLPFAIIKENDKVVRCLYSGPQDVKSILKNEYL